MTVSIKFQVLQLAILIIPPPSTFPSSLRPVALLCCSEVLRTGRERIHGQLLFIWWYTFDTKQDSTLYPTRVRRRKLHDFRRVGQALGPSGLITDVLLRVLKVPLVNGSSNEKLIQLVHQEYVV